MNASKPAIWAPGDWNALFGFGTNILLNLLVLTGLLRFVLKMPDSLVFGRILPACGLMLFMSTMYYAWLAYQLARTTGRNDVTALPSGTSVPHMFVVVFVIMLPITLRTGDPIKGWEAGLTWVFVQSFVLMIGGFIGPWIRKVTPRAALLGTLAGVSIAFISITFFGFMHGEAIGFAQSPVVALAYVGVATVLFGCARYATTAPQAVEPHMHSAVGQAAG